MPHVMSPTSSASRRRGFTFIEVMFAVLIMGLGVIMIAAMLPVALKKTQQTRETVGGAAAVETAWHQIELAALNPPATFDSRLVDPLPVTNPFDINSDGVIDAADTDIYTWPAYDNFADYNTASPPSLVIPAFEDTFGNRVVSADPTYGWFPFLRREPNAQPEIAIVAVKARNIEVLPTSLNDDSFRAFFDVRGRRFNGDNDPNNDGGELNYDILPLPVAVQVIGGSVVDGDGLVDAVAPDRIVLEERAGATNQQIRQAAVEGAVVVVADGLNRMRIYRLADPVTEDEADSSVNDATTWFLDPDAALDTSLLSAGAIANDPVDDLNFDEFGIDSRNFVDGFPTKNGYLIGRMLETPSLPWAEGQNPYVGPTQVVGFLEGQPVTVE